MKKILFLLLISLTTTALEIDEKLTIRLLDVSKSKKTVLVNRGLEDGLVIGDHAKFFLTTGVIARGVVVKASPSRSIWSVYRIVNGDSITKQKVLNLKISSAVKLTPDGTKSIRALVDDSTMGEPVDIIKDVADSGQSLSDHSEDSSELTSLMSDGEVEAPKTSRSKSGLSIEAWGLLSMSSLSGIYSSNGTDTNSSKSSLSLTGGLEKYFPSSTGIFKNLSLKLVMSKQSDELGTTSTSSISQTDMGAGAAYYFGRGPFMNNSMMYFVDGLFGVSSTDLTTSTSDTLAGTGNFLSFGAGFKYMFQGKFGAIGRADYYSSTASFDIDNGTGDIITDQYSVKGPRVLFGLFYRFL